MRSAAFIRGFLEKLAESALPRRGDVDHYGSSTGEYRRNFAELLKNLRSTGKDGPRVAAAVRKDRQSQRAVRKASREKSRARRPRVPGFEQGPMWGNDYL